MSSSAPAPATVLEVFDALDSPGTPLTTPEVAEEFDCVNRTIYNKLDALVDEGSLETKKVGARGRVWWRPPTERELGDGHDPEFTLDDSAERTQADANATESTFRELFKNAPGSYLIVEPETYEIVAVNDAYLDATMTERAEILGSTLFEVFPATPDDTDAKGVQELRASLERVKAKAEADVMPVTHYPIPRRKSDGEEFEDRWWSPINSPMFNSAGDIDYIIHRVENVTPVVNEFDADGEDILRQQYDASDSQQTAEIMLRGRELQEAKEDAYDQLRESEERLRLATDAAELGVWELNLQTNESPERSPRHDEIFGYEKRDEWSVETFFDHVHPDDRERIEQSFEDAFETGDWAFDCRIIRADDEHRWISAQGKFYDDDEGEPVRAVGTVEDITDRRRQERLQEEQTQLLERIASGAPLEECLSSLCTTVSTLDPTTRASIVLTDDEHKSFERCIAPEHSLAWREELEGLPIDDSQIGTCGEAVFRGKPITCENVKTDDRWSEDWRELCLANDVLAGHSVPIHDEDGEPLGSFMLCFDEPRTPTEWELLAEFGRHVASIALERNQSRQALRESNDQLTAELDAAQQLQDTSTSLFQEDDIDTLYEEVLDAAVTIMDADFASMQRFDADRGELELLTHQGFSPEAEETWGWVDPDEGTSCARALETGDRVVVPDAETSAFMAGTSDLEMFRQTGIQAVQTTPLVSRSGELLGMISTHWNEPHDPSERDLRSLDVLARQVADLIEQKQADGELHEREEQLSSLKDRLLETSPTGILLVDDAGEISFANDRVADILGRSVEELTGLAHNAPEFDFIDPDGEPIPEAELPYEQVRRTSDAVFSIEVGTTQPDGQRVWLSVNAAPLYDDLSDEAAEVMVALEDITERKQATEALDHLNDASRELMNAAEQEIVDEAAPLMQTVLDVEYAGLWGYDSDTGELRQWDERADPLDCDDIRYPDGFEERAWQTFVSEDRDVSNDLSPHPEIAQSETPIRSEVIVPLGRHGILCAGSTRPNEFEETTIDLAETVATNVETALDRADREGQLARQNEALTRLDRLNSIIREIDQILVQADTREEIDRVVCERLADSNLYEFAWIGEHDAAADTIDPQEWAGVDSGYVDELTITTDDTPTGQGPVGTAVRTRETQVVEDIATDARFGPWREQTLAQGVRSCISIPLVYEDALYGVLTVYAGPLNTDEKDRAVLNEFGETIAHAINAIETKETLHTDSVVELTLGIQPSNSVLGRLAQHAGCRFEFVGLVPQADDSSHVFFTAHDATSDEILAAGSEAVAVKELTRITDREDSSLFKARLSGPTLASLLVEQDAVVRTLTFKPNGATAVVDLPSTATVREFIEAIQTTHSDTDLLTRRTRERAIQTPHEFKTAVKERLTARQQETLRTAYLSGFFQSPRESTGQEIAGLLEISQTTFTQHLRAGQHDLFELLFDEA